MTITKFSIPRILTAWIGAGAIRVLLGASTSPIAYFFFGVFWLISIALFIAAVRQIITRDNAEQRIEAIAVCAGLMSLFVQGLVGGGDTIVAAVAVFLASAVVLLIIYGRKLRRRHPIHP
jgi:hypothetical protein